MSIDDGNYSRLLTDLSIVGYRNPELKILLNIKPGKRRGRKPPVDQKTKYYNGLVKVLSQSLAERLARKLSRRQYINIRHKADGQIRRTR